MDEFPPFMNPEGDHPNPQGGRIANDMQHAGLIKVTNCACGENSWDNGTMVVCDKCKMWQHAVCFLELETKSSGFCLRCARENPSLTCRDPSLVNLSPECAQMMCRIRRVLDFIRNQETLDPCHMMSYLSIDEGTALTIIEFLWQENIIGIVDPTTSCDFTVNRGVLLNRAYPKWLKCRQREGKAGFERVP